MPSLTPWNPVLLTPASSTPIPPAEQPPHGPPPSRGRPRHFLAVTLPARGPPTQMSLFALPLVASPHQPAPLRHSSSSTLSLRGGPRSIQIGGCGSSHARVTCRYAFGLHTRLRTHNACHFRANFARISHHLIFKSNVLYHEFGTN